MSKREINIELRSSGGKKVESDLSGVRKASTDLVVNIKKLGGAFGDLGSIAGNVLSNILKGGIWGIMAASVQGAMALCVKAWNKHKEAAEKAAEAAKAAFDKMTKGVADKIAAVGNAFTAAITGIDKMTASYDKQTAAVKNLILAQIELEKQRNIASGMSTEDASAIAAGKSARAGFDADEKMLRHHIEMNQRKVAEARRAEEEETAIAESNARKRERLRAAYASKRDRYVDRKSITEGVSTSGLGYNSAADVAADRAAKAREFDESEEGKELLRRLDEFDKNIKAAKAKAKEAGEVAEKAAGEIASAQSGIAAIVERRTALEVEELNKLAAVEKKTAEERIAQKKKLAQAEIELEKQRNIASGMSTEDASDIAAVKSAAVEIAAEEERLQAETEALAKRRATAEAEAQRGRSDAEKAVLAEIAAAEERLQAETEALAKRRAAAEEDAQKRRADAEKRAVAELDKLAEKVNAEQAKMERAQLQDRIRAIQDANAKELAELDKKLAAERQKAAEWERKAQKARDAAQGGGAGFSDWQRAERGGGKEERRARRQQESAERRARDTIRDLERRERQQRGGLNAEQQRRLDAARRFIAMQDPKNNPAAKAAAELEKKKLAAIEKTQKSIDDLKTSIEQRTVL